MSDEEGVDIADMMMEGEEEETDKVPMTEEEFTQAVSLKRKIRKAATRPVFSNQPFFQSVEYKEKLDKMKPVQLQEIYDDILRSAQEENAPSLYTNLYAGASKLTETLLTEKIGVNVSGYTEANMASPEIRLALEVIELEYGIEALGFEMTPLRTLAICSGMNLIAAYQHNLQKTAAPAGGGAVPQQQQPPQPPPPVPQQAAPPANNSGGELSANEELARAMAFLSTVNAPK